jgi:hypothetical protein
MAKRTWAATVLSTNADDASDTDHHDDDSDHSPEPPGADAAPTHSRSRTRHSIVEQQYRHRLNLQFKHLLDILPATVQERDHAAAALAAPPFPKSHQNGITGLPSPPLIEENHRTRHQSRPQNQTAVAAAVVEERGERRVSKAEVLDRARLYIEALEREHMRLGAERRELDLMWGEYCRREEEERGERRGTGRGRR